MSEQSSTQELQNSLEESASGFNVEGILNKLSKIVLHKSQANNYIFQCYKLCEMALNEDEKENMEKNIDKIIDLSLDAFVSNSAKLRSITIRLLRYCMFNQEVWLKYLRKRIDFFIAKNLDMSTNDREIEQSLKLLVNATISYPKDLPESITSCIQAHCGDITIQEDRFDSVYVYMFCNIVMEQPDFLRKPYVKITFFNLLSKISHTESIECLVDVMLYAIEYISPKLPSYKKINYFRMLAPVALETNTDCKLNLATITHVYTKMNELSQYPINISLKLILDSWTGIFDFGMDPLGLNTTLSQLPYENIHFQMQFITLLYDYVEAPFPAYKNSLVDTLTNYVTNFKANLIDNNNNSNTLNSADEALHDILSINGPTVYLVDLGKVQRTYKILVLYHCDILKYLTLLIMDTQNMELKTIYVILLAEIIFQALGIDTLLPALCTHGMGILDELRHKIHPIQNDVMTKFDFVVRSVCQYISWKTQFSFISNFSLLTYSYFYLLPKLDKPRSTKVLSKSSINSSDRLEPSGTSNVSKNNDVLADEIISIKQMCSNSSNNWNWETLLKFFYHPELLSMEKHNSGIVKILEHLLDFFSFGNNLHSYKFLENDEMKVISLTGITIVRYLSKMSNVPNISELITSYYKSISNFLIPDKTLDEPDAYMETVGALNESTMDCRLNIVTFMMVTAMRDPILVAYMHTANIFLKLDWLCQMNECTNFFKNLIVSMEYQLDSPSYNILKKCLLAPDNHELRLFVTKFLRFILRTDIESFNKWGIEFLIVAIWDNNPIVVKEALSILLEAAVDKSVVIKMYKMQLTLKSIPDSSKLAPRFLSIPSIINACIKNGYAKQLMDEWENTYYFEYPTWVKDSIHQYSHDKNVKTFFPSSISPPYHLYGELCQTNEGFEMLYKNKIIEQIIFDFNKNYLINKSNTFFAILPPLWAIGHIGATILGIKYLLKIQPQIISILTKLIHMSTKFYSVKGDALYVVNMLQTTKLGQHELKKCGWTKNNIMKTNKTSSELSNDKNPENLYRLTSISMGDISNRKMEFIPEVLPKGEFCNLQKNKRLSKNFNSDSEDLMILQNECVFSENTLPVVSSNSSKSRIPRQIGRSTTTFKAPIKKSKRTILTKSSSITWKGVSTRMKTFLSVKKGAAGKMNAINEKIYKDSTLFPLNTQLETFLTISNENLNFNNNESIDLTVASKCFSDYFKNVVLLPTNYHHIQSFFKLNCKFNNTNKFNTAREDLKQLQSDQKNSPLNQPNKNQSSKTSQIQSNSNDQISDYTCVSCGPNSKCFNLLLKHDSGSRTATISNEIFQSSRNFTSSQNSNQNIKDDVKSSEIAILELLRLIFLLVTAKLTTELEKSLRFIKGVYPSLFKSLCVYDKCMYIADHYNGSLETRRIIHQLFSCVEYPSVLQEYK